MKLTLVPPAQPATPTADVVPLAAMTAGDSDTLLKQMEGKSTHDKLFTKEEILLYVQGILTNFASDTRSQLQAANLLLDHIEDDQVSASEEARRFLDDLVGVGANTTNGDKDYDPLFDAAPGEPVER